MALLDEPDFSPEQLDDKNFLESFEGEPCNCFRDWDPDKCASCGHLFKYHQSDKCIDCGHALDKHLGACRVNQCGCRLFQYDREPCCQKQKCGCRRFRPMLRPDCPHVAQVDHQFSLERWAELQRETMPEEYTDLPVAPIGTDALPGEPEKIAVMSERVEQFYSPFNREDLKDLHEAIITQPINADGEVAPERNGRIVFRQYAIRKGLTRMLRWRCTLPDGTVWDDIRAWTKSEARTELRKRLGIPKKLRLPEGTLVEEFDEQAQSRAAATALASETRLPIDECRGAAPVKTRQKKAERIKAIIGGIRAAIESRSCPTCGAQPGTRCRGAKTHKKRRADARTA